MNKKTKKRIEKNEAPSRGILVVSLAVVALLFVAIFVFGKQIAHEPEVGAHTRTDEQTESHDETIVEEHTETTEAAIDSVETH